MCGRYTLTGGPADVADRFGAPFSDHRGTRRFNIAPTEEVVAVVPGPGGEREARVVRWGLLRHWVTDPRAAPPLFNARAETVLEKPAFRDLVARPRGRCLVPADGFLEWLRPEDPKAPRTPLRFTVDGGAPFAFAGLWCEATVAGRRIASATILTTSPNALVRPVHDRMPVILPGPEAEAAWLAPDLEGADAVAACVPLDPARMTATPVSRRLNRSGLDDEGPDLLVPDDDAPVAPAQAALF